MEQVHIVTVCGTSEQFLITSLAYSTVYHPAENLAVGKVENKGTVKFESTCQKKKEEKNLMKLCKLSDSKECTCDMVI
jgi:hypothetical protein